MRPKNKLTLIGSGWLGMAIAKQLCHTYSITATTTTKSKLSNTLDIKMSLFDICHYLPLVEINTSDILLVAIPPKKTFTDYEASIKNFIKTLSNTDMHIIFISSTSVYSKIAGTYDENSLIEGSLSRCENHFLTLNNPITRLRPAGLFGGTRISGKMFAGKEVSLGQNSVNHIHQIDIVNIIEKIIDQKITGVYNLVSPKHPTKQAVYLANAKFFDFNVPLFLKDEKPFKRVIDGDKIVRRLNYDFVFSDPEAFR